MNKQIKGLTDQGEPSKHQVCQGDMLLGICLHQKDITLPSNAHMYNQTKYWRQTLSVKMAFKTKVRVLVKMEQVHN